MAMKPVDGSIADRKEIKEKHDPCSDNSIAVEKQMMLAMTAAADMSFHDYHLEQALAAYDASTGARPLADLLYWH